MDARYLYEDSLRIAAKLYTAGNAKNIYVYGLSVNAPEYFIREGIKYRIIKDHLGSPRLVVNVDTGEIAQQMNHNEFGRVTLDTNPGFQDYGFAGGIYESATGLVRFGARDYDPQTGRWTAKDPIGFNGGDTNLYGYVANDPINGFDPLGLYTEVIGWNGVGSGSSSFGHVSVIINGTSYSFGPGGLDTRSASDYLALNGFRSGSGIILNLTGAQEAAFASYLKNNSGSYGALSNNCGSPVQSGLQSLGVLSGGSSILPNNVMSAIGASPNAIGQTYYPASPAIAAPASPWGHINSP